MKLAFFRFEAFFFFIDHGRAQKLHVTLRRVEPISITYARVSRDLRKNCFTMDTQKIQTDSKEDIHFLVNQLQDATDMATSQHFTNNSLDEETQRQVRDLMNQVRIGRMYVATFLLQ